MVKTVTLFWYRSFTPYNTRVLYRYANGANLPYVKNTDESTEKRVCQATVRQGGRYRSKGVGRAGGRI